MKFKQGDRVVWTTKEGRILRGVVSVPYRGLVPIALNGSNWVFSAPESEVKKERKRKNEGL